MNESLFRPKILERARVNKLLEAIFETPLFYLSASMGYGKTTAIRCFLEKRKDTSVTWIPVSAAEGDEKWLWHKLGCAIQKYNPSFAEKFLNLGYPETDYEIRSVLDLVEEFITEPIVIVFDDYQDAKCPILDRILSIYTEYNMKDVHVVVISRMRPPAEFLMLNIKNRCMLMWQGEIAFTKEETRELFELNGFNIDTDQLDDLYNYTMGWVAPTYLVLLEFASNQNIGVITESTELIKVAVYDQLNEVSQRILRMLAPVDKFSLELGEYITQDKRINNVLQEMLMNNCFINLIPQSKEYQFHTLFRHTLLEELRKVEEDETEISEKEILDRCGRWHRMQGNILLAIDYFDKAGNYDVILEMMAEMGATEYIDIAPKLIIDVFNHMTLDKKLSNPIGYLTFIHSYLTASQSVEPYKMLCEAKAYYFEHEEIDNWKHITGEIYLIESYTLFSQPKQMLKYIMKAYERLNEGRSLISGPNMVCTCGNIHVSSIFHRTVGGYQALNDFLVANLGYFKHVANGCTAGMKYLVQAEYAYDTGDIEAAKMFAYKSIYKAETKQQLSIILDAYFVLMRISFIEGKLDEIEKYMGEIERRAATRMHPMVCSSIEMIKGYIYGISGQYQKMPEWSKKFDMAKGMESLPKVIVAPINLGIALLRKKEYIQLEVVMEACIEEYKKQQTLYEMIYAYILSAIAKLQLYDEDEGVEVLEEAIKIAEPDQIIMPFIEYREEIRVLLENLSNICVFAKKILEYETSSSKAVSIEESNRQGMQDLLTEREKDVMHLFVKGYKQSEVAKELQISIDTVKRHIKNVYTKLDIHSKAELIEKLGQRL